MQLTKTAECSAKLSGFSGLAPKVSFASSVSEGFGMGLGLGRPTPRHVTKLGPLSLVHTRRTEKDRQLDFDKLMSGSKPIEPIEPLAILDRTSQAASRCPNKPCMPPQTAPGYRKKTNRNAPGHRNHPPRDPNHTFNVTFGMAWWSLDKGGSIEDKLVL